METFGECKISNFGSAERTDDGAGGAHTPMKSMSSWMAPEVFDMQEKRYNFKIDIWSVGCIVLEMWAGHRVGPWNDESTVAMSKVVPD